MLAGCTSSGADTARAAGAPIPAMNQYDSMEFLYLLLFRESEAWSSQDVTKLSEALEFQRRFLNTNLAAWIGKFCDAVRSSAQCEFYRELADLTEKFIHLQTVRINSR
jgi:TorA maturation chaperone TorD